MNSQNKSHRFDFDTRKFNVARNALFVLVFFMTGCAATVEEETEDSSVLRRDPIGDYIVVSELKKIRNLKPVGTLRHELLTWRHVILRDRRKTYLIDFGRKCGALGDKELSSEVVPSAGRFRVPVDTYRGCSFQSIYPLSKEQEKELSDLTDKLRR